MTEMAGLLPVCDRSAEGVHDETERDMTMGCLCMYTAAAEGRIECLREELRTAFVEALNQAADRSRRCRPER